MENKVLREQNRFLNDSYNEEVCKNQKLESLVDVKDEKIQRLTFENDFLKLIISLTLSLNGLAIGFQDTEFTVLK